MNMPPANPYGSPVVATGDAASNGGQRHSSKTLQRIDPMTLALMQGAVCALIGVIPAIAVVGMAIIGAAGSGSGSSIAGGLVAGLIIAVLAPLLYGVLGFLGGFVLALMYNLCASLVGGIVMEFDE